MIRPLFTIQSLARLLSLCRNATSALVLLLSVGNVSPGEPTKVETVATGLQFLTKRLARETLEKLGTL
jgi:hypothetical protein